MMIEELQPRDRIIMAKVYLKMNEIIMVINRIDDRIKILEDKKAVT
jgi:hypothetical protein